MEPSMKIHVQRATAEDFSAIAALDAKAWGQATYVVDGEHTWRIWCEFSKVYIIRGDEPALADTQGVAAAMVLFLCDDGRAMLHKIMVHSSCRGKGLGTQLMQEALSHATTDVLLTVDPANTRAFELYRHMGFETLKHVPGFYRPNEHRDLMVWKPGKKAAK